MFLETSSPSSGATTPTHQKPPSREDGEALDETASNDVCASTPLPKQRSPLHRLLDDVSVTNAEYPLLACCIVAGLVDSVVFNATGVFASMQTGNTIFLALGASGYPPNTHLLWLRAIVSISAFWLGCFFFSRARHFHPRRKVVLSFFFLLQGMFIVAAAALAQTNAVPAFGWTRLPTTSDASLTAARAEYEEEAITLLPLALLAFQFGGQIVASRVLGYNEIPTNVLTSLYCDLLSDPLLVAGLRENPKRNRRIAAIFLTVGGGIGGGWLQRSAGGMGSALWIAAAIKIAIAVAWLAWGSNIESPASLRAEKTAVSVNQQVV